MSKNCLILFLSGHEVRQFGHSGMISELINNGWNVTVAAKIIDDDLTQQLDTKVKFIPLYWEAIPQKFHRIQKLLDQSHIMFQKIKGKSIWIDAWQPDMSTHWGKFTNFIIRLLIKFINLFPRFYNILLEYEQTLENEWVSNYWLDVLNKLKINLVIINTPRSEILHPVLIAAKMLKIPRYLFYHSIKDVSAKGRIIHKFSGIGVWNQWMKDEIIQQNSDILKPELIHIAGCAHFDCVGRDDLLIPEERFRKLIGAKQNSRLLIYPAAVNWVVPDQGRYIQIILKAIEQGKLPPDLQIIIRTNPMDLTNYFETYFKTYENVLIQNSDWRMETDGGWNFQRRNDMLMYNSLLRYSSLCFGIPSTVTVECAVAHLPVINICFDLPDPKPPRSMSIFWNADFYKEIIHHKVAIFSGSENELIENIAISLKSGNETNNIYERFISEFLGVNPPNSSKKYFEIINN